MNLSLAKIQSFVAVAEAGQFRKAGERLSVSQPALSTHIRDLERGLGTALFSRTTRSVRLTVEGERFLVRVSKVLDDLHGAIAEVRDQAELKRGRVTIAATPSVASNVLPAVVAAFMARHPGVRVQLIEDQSSGVEQRVESGEADFGVGPLSVQRADFSFSLVCRDRFVGVVGADHPLAQYGRVRLAELLKYSLLTTTPESNIRSILKDILEARGIAFQTDHILTQHQTVIAMVTAGLGVALLPVLTLGLFDRSNVVLLEVVDPEVTRDIGILQRKGGSISAASREFLNSWTAPSV